MPSSETFNLEHTDLRITIVRQFPLARQTADELSSWATGPQPGGVFGDQVRLQRNRPVRAASLPLEAPQGVQSHEPDRPTGVEFYFEQVGGTQVLPLLETKRRIHRS